MNDIETFYGLVENTLDALRIFQMCREGRLNRVRRRLHERERRLIRSGSVFVFDEEESGIRRWTDGRLWSPSRILGNFLIYRELEKKGHRTSTRNSNQKHGKNSYKSSSVNVNSDINSNFLLNYSQKNQKISKLLPKNLSEYESTGCNWGHSDVGIENGQDENESQLQIQQERWDIVPRSINPKELNTGTIIEKLQYKGVDQGNEQWMAKNQHSSSGANHANNFRFQQIDPMSGESLRVLKSKKLTNNHKGRYTFKANGFIKKTISIQLEGHTNHLVAYYSLEDFCRGHLQLEEGEGKDIFDSENFDLKAEDFTLPTHATTNEEIDPHRIQNTNETIQSTIPYDSSCPLTNSMTATNIVTRGTMKQPQSSPLPFDPQLMEILRQVSIPVDLMLQQNFRKPAALLASATSTAQNLLEGNPENGEKLITALEYGAINPIDLQSRSNPHSHSQVQNHTSNPTSKMLQQQQSLSKKQYLLQRENSGFNEGGGIIFSSSTSLNNTKPSYSPEGSGGNLLYPRPRRHSSFHPPLQNFYPVLTPASNSSSSQNQSVVQESVSYDDNSYINDLDEAAQLSGEALEFLSHYSSDESRAELDFSVDTITAASLLPSSENDLETELFGTILSDADQLKSNAIRGEDILFN